MACACVMQLSYLHGSFVRPSLVVVMATNTARSKWSSVDSCRV